MAFDKGEWKPTRKQEQFLSLPLSLKEAGYGGGAGSAKTDVLLVYGLVHRWHENPRFKQVFMRRTFPELRNEIIPRSREIYTKFGATLNKSDMAWTFPRPDQYGARSMTNGGAMIFLGQCEDENDVHKYDSMEINLFTPDEITSFTEFIYLYIGFTRVRTSDPTLPAIIRTAGMPGGIGHTWFKKRFIDPCKQGGKIIIGKGGNKRIYIHATLADNPHIDAGYAQSLDALPEAEKRAKKFGDWDAYQGQVFDEFRDRHYPDEPENALHVVQPFIIPAWWPRIVVIDWGFAAMNYVTYSAISPNGRIYTYREQHWLKTKIEEWAPYVKEYCDKENPRIVKLCKSGGQERGQEHTIQEQISAALDRVVELSDNSAGSRVSGKLLMHEYLRWKPKHIPEVERPIYSEEYAMWLLRNKGDRDYKLYLSIFDPPKDELLPKWQIFYDESTKEGCPVLINTIKSCSYDKPKKNKPAEDVAEFDGDDPYDNARYLLDSADHYFVESAKEFEKIKEQQRIVDLLASEKDWTAFYRNMKKSESKVRIKAISRYHRHGGRSTNGGIHVS